VTNLHDLILSLRAELPPTPLERWAAVFFSLSVLTLLISLSASQAFLALAGVLYAIHWLRVKPPLAFPPVKLPVALFCLFSVLSVIWAANPGAGWLAIRKIVLLVILPLAANLVTRQGHLELLFYGLFLESALAGLVAAGQFVVQYRAVRLASPERIYAYMISQRITGFMGHWMNFGGQQMLVFAALVAFLFWARRNPSSKRGQFVQPNLRSASKRESDATEERGTRERSTSNVWFAMLAVVALSIVLNFTRGVWLGCFLATLYLVARRKPGWLWGVPVLVVAAYLAAPTLVRERVILAFHPWRDPALSMRFEMWRVGLRMIQRHPLVGVGLNNIEQVYDLYLPPGKTPEVGYHGHLHSDFIQLAAERGLPCLGAWLWFMGALGWQFVRIRRRLISATAPWVADAAFACWLAFAVEGFFEYNFGTSPVLMLFLFVVSTPFVAERFERAG